MRISDWSSDVCSSDLRTVHYVSPSVWAWRESRAAKIGASAELVLCLFPMEPPIYARHGVDARFTGHPLADAIAMEPDLARSAARRVGQECVRTGRSRGSALHKKKKNNNKK